MTPTYFLTELSTDQVKLGRLVTNIWTPYNAFYDPPFISYTPVVHEVIRHSSKFCLHRSNKSSIGSTLSKLFGIDYGRSSNTFLRIEAKSISTQTISNYSDAFEFLWSGIARTPGDAQGKTDEVDRTREWIQNRLEDSEDVFMVVGIRTITDATVTVHESSDVTTRLNAGIPVTELVSSGLSMALGSALDVTIAMGVGRAGGVGEKYEVRGTRVMAVQYCRVKVGKWWKGKDVAAKLAAKQVVWEWFIGNGLRGTTPSNTGPQDPLMVVVALGDMVDAAEIMGVNDDEGHDAEGNNEDEDEDRIQSFSVDGVELVF